jgi:hypothetical protein
MSQNKHTLNSVLQRNNQLTCSRAINHPSDLRPAASGTSPPKLASYSELLESHASTSSLCTTQIARGIELFNTSCEIITDFNVTETGSSSRQRTDSEDYYRVQPSFIGSPAISFSVSFHHEPEAVSTSGSVAISKALMQLEGNPYFSPPGLGGPPPSTLSIPSSLVTLHLAVLEKYIILEIHKCNGNDPDTNRRPQNFKYRGLQTVTMRIHPGGSPGTDTSPLNSVFPRR